MTTDEIERLYIKHADDFRAMTGGSYMADLGDLAIVYSGTGLVWSTVCRGVFTEIPAALAVAAMTEAWRERLEKEYGMPLCHAPERKTLLGNKHFLSNTKWHDFCAKTVPEAICAAVAALAAKKRAEAVAADVAEIGAEMDKAGFPAPADHPKSEPPPAEVKTTPNHSALLSDVFQTLHNLMDKLEDSRPAGGFGGQP